MKIGYWLLVGLSAGLAHADSDEDAAVRKFVDRMTGEYSTLAPNAAADNILLLCDSRWPSDYAMQEYCQNEQIKAYGTYSQTRSGLLAASTTDDASIKAKGIALNDAARLCESRWTIEGVVDFQMTMYCLNQQAEAYDRIRARR